MMAHLDFTLKVKSLDDLLCDVAYAHVIVLPNGKDDRLDVVVVLAQLPYEHPCEVIRVHKLAQRLACTCNDKRRAILYEAFTFRV
jgi:hypothetical protein